MFYCTEKHEFKLRTSNLIFFFISFICICVILWMCLGLISKTINSLTCCALEIWLTQFLQLPPVIQVASQLLRIQRGHINNKLFPFLLGMFWKWVIQSRASKWKIEFLLRIFSISISRKYSISISVVFRHRLLHITREALNKHNKHFLLLHTHTHTDIDIYAEYIIIFICELKYIFILLWSLS